MGSTTLVIGYGNTLRGDDGVGYRIAEALEPEESLSALGQTERSQTVRSLPCHQLTPDLAANLAEVDRVIFVDAIAPGAAALGESELKEKVAAPADSRWWQSDHPRADPIVQIQILTPTAAIAPGEIPGLAHGLTPQTLLDLADVLYGHAPEAYWILIPTASFEFGETLSDLTQAAMAIALDHIRSICAKNPAENPHAACRASI